MDNLWYLLDFQGDLSCLTRLSRRENSKNPERPTNVLAIDCEMISTVECDNRVARCSVVNMYGYTVLDAFVDPECRVLNYRTRWSGISKNVINQAREDGTLWDLRELQDKLERMFDGRVIVGHNIKNDLNVLGLANRIYVQAIDTQEYPKSGKQPGLKNLLQKKFGLSIQNSDKGHNSVEDACGAMLLYRVKRDWFDQRVFTY